MPLGDVSSRLLLHLTERSRISANFAHRKELSNRILCKTQIFEAYIKINEYSLSERTYLCLSPILSKINGKIWQLCRPSQVLPESICHSQTITETCASHVYLMSSSLLLLGFSLVIQPIKHTVEAIYFY